ncbi:hypothetical protein JQX13_24575 [Archangium violaceum]|uniref:hypothetical protein n=1 Tax=Archangium violaceum TaxID=83451 RepID=UPI00193C3ACD|nr:hypothetical protein [Archangium violaceum]QRK12924.1 hypothetical protein JQX13_24575 [Archangium violaceum]
MTFVRCGDGSSGELDAGVIDNETDGGAPDASSGGSVPVDGGDVPDGGAPDASMDAGEPADGGGNVPDAGIPGGGSRLACTFNSECPVDERCECDESEGCMCLTGRRGAGRPGMDACTSGNDCESSLCVEGWGGYYCSGQCYTDTDCGPQLPICSSIAFIGNICIRQPDGGR